jgi:hypothetical protein
VQCSAVQCSAVKGSAVLAVVIFVVSNCSCLRERIGCTSDSISKLLDNHYMQKFTVGAQQMVTYCTVAVVVVSSYNYLVTHHQ